MLTTCMCTSLHTQVTVQAGCRVQQVADALKGHGLSLQNYASIREQQIGGFIQVCAPIAAS
jgi:L-galactono-1,4-lactone dehydrogenase